ncbi:unnamed protein product [Callosobruchus maculatus]|uniref:Major facilitator superfamily (MFS) profile domain-containing protein n=1 Tax=Callosobruchus maculatus TaxID=64391 RepID=A0A653BMM2_CALMS|nr:unnamed protein product [Callosobruchus maculatus]
MMISWTSPFLVKITKDKVNYNITEDQASYFAIIPPASMVVSAIFCTRLSDVIGRKYTIMLTALPYTTFWILTAFFSDVYVLYAARMIAGFGDAIVFTSVPMYIGEISTPKVRGTWGNFVALGIFLGQFVIHVVGAYFTVSQTALIFLPLGPLFFILMLFVPESPYYYIIKHRVEDAKKSLSKLRGKKDVEEDIAHIRQAIERQMLLAATWKELFFVKMNRKALFAGIFLRVSQQLGGVASFNIYTQLIFEKAGTSLKPENCSIIYTGICFVFMAIGSFIGDRFGRKKAYITSCCTCGVVLLLEAVYFYLDLEVPGAEVRRFNWFPLAGMISYVICSSFGLGTIPTLMLGELFSASIKTKGLTILTFVFGIMLFVSNNLFYLLKQFVGMYGPFLCFGLCCLVSSVLSMFIVPETSGKSLEQIQSSLETKQDGQKV